MADPTNPWQANHFANSAPPFVSRTEAERVIYAPRKKQACSRCHTKRIKCLGGVPCRNCTLSNSPCVFPPPRRPKEASSQHLPVLLPNSRESQPVVAVGGDEHANTGSTTSGSYRRPEKDFRIGRLSQSSYGLRPTYRGSPSCKSFVDQFTAWIAVQKIQLGSFVYNAFESPLDVIGQSESGILDSGLELSIDTSLSRPASRPEPTRPVKIRLPPYNHSLRLIESVESAIGHEQHYFRRRHLRAKVARMHQNPNSAESKDQGWLCHWLAIVALGELFSSSGQVNHGFDNGLTVSDTNIEPPGVEYYHQSVAFLQQVAEHPDVQYIETLCLLAVYAFSMDKLNTAYMYSGLSMRAALSLALHRGPVDSASGITSLSESDNEHHKRLFWTVYYQDLLTTSTTGRPWGILDDEIVIDYADSSRLSPDLALDFFDSEESNAHLELMRLRGQIYASVYGYAGTAINPHSQVSLFNFDMGGPLSQQHLDKMTEFHQTLTGWQQNLTPELGLARGWSGALLNVNRVAASLHLIYHQSILVLLRPALVNVYNDWVDHKTSPYLDTTDPSRQSSGSRLMLETFHRSSLASASEMAIILQQMEYQGSLLIYSYFDASYAFTAAITLYIARMVRTSDYSSAGNVQFTDEHQSALDIVVRILYQQSAAGNIPAREFVRQLHVLETNLQAIETSLRGSTGDFQGIDLEHLDAGLASFPESGSSLMSGVGM